MSIEEPFSEDGRRVLVERLWPRGVSKQKAALDLWLKDVAPSPELRTWFGHDPSKWEKFRKRYWDKLAHNEAAVSELRDIAKKGDITFVYASRDTEHNAAVALKGIPGILALKPTLCAVKLALPRVRLVCLGFHP